VGIWIAGSDALTTYERNDIELASTVGKRQRHSRGVSHGRPCGVGGGPVLERLCDEGRAGWGRVVVRRAFRPLRSRCDRSPRGAAGLREACRGAGVAGERCDPLARGCGVGQAPGARAAVQSAGRGGRR
jgi:hypothetical protein